MARKMDGGSERGRWGKLGEFPFAPAHLAPVPRRAWAEGGRRLVPVASHVMIMRAGAIGRGFKLRNRAVRGGGAVLSYKVIFDRM
ncbi:hypothetical protein chiPu_0008965 [Chiloscyllium punctatum]|uniref:Uncharacterized protein n=1 Tax=Chiloscyllium punctatum TaxID=137246 RepID=A0A401SJC3_CHIPU|nr:hypothetical protein [Chiloscyllium punctatum]